MIEPVETHFLESRTPKLAFDIRTGIEPVLLCIHGNSSHRGLWGPLLDHLPDYAALRLDLRGHGESEWARPPAYSTADYADDIREAAETLSGREFVLVSHSNGSLASLYFATHLEPKPKALVYMTEHDVPRVADVIRAAFEEYRGRLDPPSSAHHKTAEIVGRELANGSAFVACDPQAIVGCVFYHSYPDHLYLDRLAVLPSHRGRGIARELIRAVEQRAGQYGLGEVRLSVRRFSKESFMSLRRRPETMKIPWVRTLPACSGSKIAIFIVVNCLRTPARWKRAYPGIL